MYFVGVRLASRLAVLAIAAVAALMMILMLGSTQSAAQSAHFSIAKDPKVAALVPAAIKKKGTLTVVADATYPPNEFIKSGKVVGWDPELGVALGKVMGLKVSVRNVTFDSIIPGLKAKKFDIGMSSFTDTKAREKVVDFVTYYEAGTAFYVSASDGPNIRTLADLCGKTVAAEKGTTQVDDSTAQNDKCKAAGKSGVTVNAYPDQNGVNLALASKRADVGMADSVVAAYIVKQSGGKFKLSGKPYAVSPYGIALPKNGLAKAVRAAMIKLVKSGDYLKILKKWGIQEGALKASQVKINAAIS